MRSATERTRALFDGPFGAVYSFYMERERLSRLIARVVWGADIRPFYESMRAIGEAEEGATIVDAPCGSGVALRALPAAARVRYLGVDASPRMLERASRRAAERRLSRFEPLQADAEAIPIPDGCATLFLSYFGLHCFDHPAAAVGEMARCLRPGGRVVGSMITTGHSARHRMLVTPSRGGFGPGGTTDDLRGWLRGAGFADPEVRATGLFTYFDAVKGANQPDA